MFLPWTEYSSKDVLKFKVSDTLDLNFHTGYFSAFFPALFIVCPKIIDFVVPPVVFVGAQEKVYITIQANPPVEPQSVLSIYLEPHGREIAFSTVKEGTVLNFTYVYIFEVPSDISLEDEPTFEVLVSVQSSKCVLRSPSKTIHKIQNGEQCETSSVMCVYQLIR